MNLHLRACGVLLLLPLSFAFGVKPVPTKAKPHKLPNYDIRREASEKGAATLGNLRTAHKDEASTARAAKALAGMKAAQEKLATRTVNLRVENAPHMNVPEVVDANGGAATLTVPSNARRETVMRRFVMENAALFGLEATQAEGLRTDADYSNPAGNLSWVEMQQMINGIPVFQGNIRGSIRKDGALVRTTGTLAAGLDYARLAASPRLSAKAALKAGAQAIGVELDEAGLPDPVVENEGKKFTFPAGTFDQEVKGELLYFPVELGVVTLAYSMVLWEPINAYWVLVDADSGEMLWRKNITNDQTQTATFSVYDSDSPAPLSPSNATPGSGIQAAGVARTSFTLVSELPAFDNLGWIPDGANVTTGNNVDAGLDIDATNGIDANGRATGTNRVFNFTYSPGGTSGQQAPTSTTYRMGVVTNLFFWSNRYHDRMYLYGFTEAARNFQQNNFGRGGVQNDRVLAESQDASGTDNANFSTPPDGQSGRMQMYVFTGPNPDRDGDLDQEIVIHELTHGLSNRLHANASGLVTLQSGGMGEGWSDFYARCLLSTADEDVGGVYASGGYSTLQLDVGFTDNYYYGIRRFPYALKTTVGPNGKPHNPLTLGDIDPAKALLLDGANSSSPVFGGNNALEVHNIGEVWCMALLEVRARLITRLGFQAGNDRVLQIVTDGMKLDPASPTLIQARDSILAADQAGFAGADVADIWAGFAAVGMGFGATSTATANLPASVVESFFTPNLVLGAVTFTDSTGNNSGFADPGESIVLTVPIANTTGTAATGVTANVTGGGSADYGSIPNGGSATRQINFTVPQNTPSGTRLPIPISIDSSLGLAGPLTPTFVLTIGQQIVGLTQNFDASASLPTGWTTAATGSSPVWTISTVNPDSPTRVAFAGNTVNIGTADLTTPPIPITTASAKLTFRTAYNLEADLTFPSFYDGMVLEVSIDGGTFTDIVEAGGIFLTGGYNATIDFLDNPLIARNAWSGLSGGTSATPGYITCSVQLPASFNGSSVRFRWRVGTDSSVVAPGVAGARVDGVVVESGTTFIGSPPVLTTSAGNLTYLENQAPTPVDPGLTVTDIDSSDLTGATVSISSDFVSGQDGLAFTDQGAITGSYDSATGTLTLAGTATVAAYQTALRAVTFESVSENPSNVVRTITFSATDSTGSATAARSVVVIAVNDPPTLAAIPTLPSIPENSPLQTVNLTGISAGGGEDQTLTVTATSSNPSMIPDPIVTYVSPSETGSFTFAPLQSQWGDALITVTVTDSGGVSNGGVDSVIQTVLVRVGSINDPPSFVKGPDVFAVRGGGAQVIPGWATAISPGPPDESTQTVTFIVQTSDTALFEVQPAVDSTGALTFTPAVSGSGVATITVTAQDDGGTVDAGVDISASQSFLIAVTSFAEEVGNYAGLILPAPGGTREISRTGSVQTKLSGSGKFTGRVVLAGKRFSFKGSVGDDGMARFGRSDSPTLELKRKRDTPLSLALTVDVALDSGTMTGVIKDGATDFAVIDADRSIYTSKRNPDPPLVNPPPELVGTYTILLPAVSPADQGMPATGYPQGDGYGKIVVKSNGTAKLAGRLADGSKIGGSAPIGGSGRWPFYDKVGKGGALEGFAFFRDTPQTDIDGEDFLWIKAADRKTRRYPFGWPNGIFVDAAGSKYIAPSKRKPGPILTGLGIADTNGNAELTFTSGGLPPGGLVQPLMIDIKNKVLLLPAVLEKPKMKLSNRSGAFSGEFKTPGVKSDFKFSGAVLQKQQLGRGSFLGTTEIGLVTLAPDEDPGIVARPQPKVTAQ